MSRSSLEVMILLSGNRHSQIILVLALVAAAAACTGGESRAADRARAEKSAAGVALIDAPSAPYRAIDVTLSGSVRGAVELDGDPPADTVVRPTSDQRACGDSFLDETIDRDGAHLASVIVWIANIRAGKRTPLERRFEITNDQCRLVPRVQAAFAGGTLNVRSNDAALHRTRFVHVGRRDTLAVIGESDEGQVVPDEQVLVAPGQIEVRCDLHPWTRGWIAVFDHPYYATTGRDGAFSLDSLPPGRYEIVAWHERFGAVRDSVTVAAGAVTPVKLVFRARDAAPVK